jgi:ADP-glucose pyrophosphorylase
MPNSSPRILGIILAGGEGRRLQPLTNDRAKPAVPFGGKYRLIDFVLSNFVNSKIYSIYVLVQFKSQSLIEHLAAGWQFGSLLPEQFISPVPAQMQRGQTWYQGTADAIYQNLNLIENHRPDIVAVFGAALGLEQRRARLSLRLKGLPLPLEGGGLALNAVERASARRARVLPSGLRVSE